MRLEMFKEAHTALGALFGVVNGSEVPLHYGNPRGERLAFREAAAVVDLSYRSRLALLGADRLKFLNGQVTNNVKDLRVGSGVYAALVTAKAKMQSDLNIYALADELLLDFEPGLTEMVQQRLEKFIVADDVQIIDAAPHYNMLSVQGPKAEEVVRALELAAELPAEWMRFVTVEDASFGQVYIMNRPRTGSNGFDIFVPNAAHPMLLDKAITAVKRAGGALAGWEAIEGARIEAAIPRFGQDIDESNLASEAGIEPLAISYNKGCYIGQEIISRLKAFGQLAKGLRRLEIGPVASIPARGSKLMSEGKEVGYLTSFTNGETAERNFGMGYVRKERWETGVELTLQNGSETTRVKVAGLPYARS